MGLRGPKARGQEDWMIPVADLMVQEGMGFSKACQALGVKFDSSAAERAAEYSEAFRNILDALEFRYFARTGDNPLMTKGWLAGRLKWAIDRIAQQDQPDKLSGLAKVLADLMGWFPKEEDASRPVLGNLTQDQINTIKADLEAKQKEQVQNTIEQKIEPVVDDVKPN